MSLPLIASQTRVVPSPQASANRLPSGLNSDTSLVLSEPKKFGLHFGGRYPIGSVIAFPSVPSQTRIVPSLAVTRRRPSGLNTPPKARLCSTGLPSLSPVAASNSCHLVPPTMRSRFPSGLNRTTTPPPNKGKTKRPVLASQIPVPPLTLVVATRFPSGLKVQLSIGAPSCMAGEIGSLVLTSQTRAPSPPAINTRCPSG